MKRKCFAFIPVVALILGLMACGAMQNITDPFAYSMQGTLSTTLSSYKLINTTFTDMRAQSLITDSGWKQYETLANKFLDEHIKVDKAMAAYKRGEQPQSAVELAEKLLQEALKELKAYYINTIPKDKQQPIF